MNAEAGDFCFTRCSLSEQQETGQHFQVFSQSQVHPLATCALVAKSILVKKFPACH